MGRNQNKDKSTDGLQKQKPEITIDSVYPNVPPLTPSENTQCNFSSNQNKFLSFKISEISEEKAKSIASKYTLVDSYRKGKTPNNKLVYAWNNKEINLTIYEYPARIYLINKQRPKISQKKTDSELLQIANEKIMQITSQKLKLFSTEYLTEPKDNSNFYIEVPKEKARLIRFKFTHQDSNNRIVIMPDNEDIAEVILFSDGQLHSFSLYLLEKLEEINTYEILSCPSDITKNISSAKVISVKENQELLYDTLDYNSIKYIVTNKVDLVELVDTSNNKTAAIPYFLIRGNVQTKESRQNIEATIYINAIKEIK